MKVNRLAIASALVTLALLVSGCEWARWLRLLSLKKQLAHVERYARIDDHDGLTLHLFKPVVYADDLNLLVAGETSRATNQDTVTWGWSYQKQYVGEAPEPKEFDLAFTVLFNPLKLSEVRFSKRFLGLMPKPLILGLLRSVGQAEVNLRRGIVKARWAGPGPGEKLELPTRSKLTALLGAPFTTSRSNTTETVLYKYYQQVPTHQTPAERLAWASFTFQGEEVTASSGVIGNVGWSMTREPGKPQVDVTFALVQPNVEPVALKLPFKITNDYIGQYRGKDGTLLSIGRDGQTFAASWRKGSAGGWCTALPELTNVLFALPTGEPRFTFERNEAGAATGLVAQWRGPGERFTKVAGHLVPEPSAVPLAARDFAACAGRYKPSWGGLVQIRREGDQLFWQNQGLEARLPLYPASPTNFFFKAVDSPLTFVKNDSGEVRKFVLHFNGHTAEAVKLADK